MKIIFVLFTALFVCSTLSAQNVLDKLNRKVRDKVNQRVDRKADQAIDKGLDKTEQSAAEAAKNKKSKKKKSADDVVPEPAVSPVAGNTVSATATQDSAQGQVKKFSDFVAGANVIFSDNFQLDALSDFPAKWNTNGSGNIVTISGTQGKWLDIVHNSVVNPMMDNILPENCTIEFDLFLQAGQNRNTPFIQFGLTHVKDLMKQDIYREEKFYVGINRYDERDGRTVEYGLSEVVGNKNDFPLLSYTNRVLHVSMAINKTRLRVYLDQTKIIDLPKALTPAMRNNFFISNVSMIPASEIGVLVSNVRIASSETDARSLLIKQLMEDGKAVTNDILFDVNSDVIKPSSYAIINQFGEALKTNAALKILITGHTDSDGTAAKNLELSGKRASAVKNYLLKNYEIAATRIQTAGKGATVPVADNTTADGKLKNRRVEFVKL